MTSLKIVDVTPENVLKETLFCIKDIKNPGFNGKRQWFEKRFKEGLRMKILKDSNDKMIGFIEYVPASQAWRPVNAKNFMFIHCMYIYSKKDRNKGYGSMLINTAIEDAKSKKMNGVCTVTSKGPWIANNLLFIKNGFERLEAKDRFELLSLSWNPLAEAPTLVDWTANQKELKGWHLIYADQCPWHEKSVSDLLNVAMDFEIDLKITKLETPQEARKAPSGFGVFNLVHEGKLIEDHYLSATRFKNILQKELSS